MPKANLRIGKSELTVFFEFEDGRRAHCRYCGGMGNVNEIVVDEVLEEGKKIPLVTPLARQAVVELRRVLLHGIGCCNGDLESLREEQQKNLETAGITADL